ncbi:ATP-dependent DNA helicase RecG [hydrothermal vent metagenome]|uniref:ATP-dependent DNA helicase RecG n=1 Tax=hydrothermal vent metagenome TaxID=652676 RepID=A0A3B1C2J9_9ZZZZ
MPFSSNKLTESVQYLKGVGPKRAELFKKLDIHSIGDMLFHFPVRYEDRSNMKTISEIRLGEVENVMAKVRSAGLAGRGRGRRPVFEVAFEDETGILRASWFHFSEKAMIKKFQIGSEWIVSGKVSFNKYRHSKVIVHPDVEKAEELEAEGSLHLGRIVPIYSLTEGLTQKVVRSVINLALERLYLLRDFTPDTLNEKYRLPPLADCVRRVHWPDMGADLQKLHDFKTPEQKKLIFNEFFLVQAGLALKRRTMKKEEPEATLETTPALMEKIYSVLPFKLTGAQQNVLNEIAKDVSSKSPMNRLLQGDVGSGKTAVAVAAALIAVRNRKQAAIMAPTEILAAQHFKNISALLKDTKVEVELVTSGIKGKAEALKRTADGVAHIIIGTHALVQEGVKFHDLGLVVIDEQHRFGVRQRAELIGKGKHVHTLIMTATPIPRTLAMTLYGDLDVSVIDELPPGRSPVATTIFSPNKRENAIAAIRREVEKGRQAYIIYPLVEESEKLELKAATSMFEKLGSEDFAGLRLGLIHGRMKSVEKDEVMERFSKKEIDILVSTTVIEVGIDQPNATVIMIEHAERFGLSQLHQLRGRVGRSEHKSYCFLMADTKPGSPGWARTKAMVKYQDGFKIAEEDLAIRGAGDFFGVKQSGLPEFRIGDILRDHKILTEARKAAFKIIEEDPRLEKPEHIELKHALKEHWRERFELGDIG